LKWKNDASACIVMTSKGYPEHPQTGRAIEGLEEAARLSNAKVFHAGTLKKDSIYYTSGGRVLGVTAGGRTLAEATSVAYEAVGRIHFAGEHHRTDIGRRLANKEPAKQGSAAGN
jgi:phosphoribosylamine--glycine ligase